MLRPPRGRFSEGLPLLAVGVEIFLDFLRLAARLGQQLPGKLARAAKPEFHRSQGKSALAAEGAHALDREREGPAGRLVAHRLTDAGSDQSMPEWPGR